jgi:hypothetical protein
MRAFRAILDLTVAHCGGSYAAAAWAVAISIWLGSHDYFDLLTVALVAPLSLPVMAAQSLAQTPDPLFTVRAVALLLPAYVLGFFLTLVFWLRYTWKRALERRIAQGLCGNCGYDLTGNTSGVCPECGRQSSSSPAQGASC